MGPKEIERAIYSIDPLNGAKLLLEYKNKILSNKILRKLILENIHKASVQIFFDKLSKEETRELLRQ